MVDIFKALAEESRLRILALLMNNEMCVCEIEECLKMTQSNVSRHLTALKISGILDSYKQAQWVYYKISDAFKDENQSLWIYLTEKLKELPCYNTDFDEYQKCKQKDLCNMKKM
ncbi:MAG: metalloregulator ArsR/SmtB family transcription factor [Bacillota bacterium]|nr:metalloregulator ArsR/SmtB family transcription factor [Bacillota bacterium]